MAKGTPDRPDDLLDREKEWEALSQAIGEEGPGLLLVLGRRRAGKSYLLTRLVRARGGVYYQATKKTEREQLQDLSVILAERFDDPLLRRVSLPTWEDVLAYLLDRSAGRPFPIVLDEFPYLVEAAPALPSILQTWWDHRLQTSNVSLILSGSHISAMKRLTEADQPLYGRRTGYFDVGSFDYFDAARFVPQWTARDRLRAYALFGGLPGHLALIDPKRSLAENAARHLLSSTGRLHDEAAHLFDAFLADAAVHYSIVDAIAGGETKWSRIASRVGKQTSALSRPLEWLLDMEVIERVWPVTDFPKSNPKRSLYRLADPYLGFWYRFVSEIRGRGLAVLGDPLDLWSRMVEPRLDELHTAHIYEAACRQFVARGAHQLLPFRPNQVGSWWNADHSEEVDVVAFDGDGRMLVGECKWGKCDVGDYDRLRRRSELIAREAGALRSVSLVLFSAGGIDRQLRRQVEAGSLIHVPIERMYDDVGAT